MTAPAIAETQDAVCPKCGHSFAFGGEVGDYAQRKVEGELDDDVCDADDDDDECRAKKRAVHYGVSAAREGIGAAAGYARGGEVSFATALRQRRRGAR